MDNYICFRIPALLFINSVDHMRRQSQWFSDVVGSERFWLRDRAHYLCGARFSALFPRFDLALSLFSAVQKSIGLISGFNDVAVVGQPVEQRRSHLGVTKHA